MYWASSLASVLVFSMTVMPVSLQPHPPGVPPRTQPPAQQQYQQPPQQQYQQPPQQQYQQPPQQQQQHQQPPQQQQYQQPHGHQQQHGHHQQNTQQFNQDPNYVNVQEGRGEHLDFKADMHNAEHIMDHLQDVIETKPKDQMTEEELEFHYFKMHDHDNNNKLDGVEISKAITDYHGDEKEIENNPPKVMSDAELADVVDAVLRQNDVDNDGYIEYSEFVASQRSRDSA